MTEHNGFTGTISGHLVPEYGTPSGTGIVPPEGARLYEVNAAGTKTLRATYVNSQWIPE